MELSVAEVIEGWISSESQAFARSLFAAAQKAWNIVAPQVRRFECQEIQIPAMSEEPAEVPILWWLRSDREDCPRSLQSLTLLRWLVELHNGLLDVAVECAETHDAIAEAVCLADALRPYFFHYQPGSLEHWAKEAAQPMQSEKFDWALAAGRVRKVFTGVRRLLPDKIQVFHFRDEGRRSTRPRFQTDLPEAGKQLLLKLLPGGQQQDQSLQLLLQMEVWLRVAPSNARMSAAEFARTKMQVPVADLPEALEALEISQVCGAIECLEDAAANPLESLSETYQQGILSEAAKAELTALSPSDRVSLLREWRRFLNAYLNDYVMSAFAV